MVEGDPRGLSLVRPPAQESPGLWGCTSCCHRMGVHFCATAPAATTTTTTDPPHPLTALLRRPRPRAAGVATALSRVAGLAGERRRREALTVGGPEANPRVAGGYYNLYSCLLGAMLERAELREGEFDAPLSGCMDVSISEFAALDAMARLD